MTEQTAEYVILVDENDRQIAVEEKLKVHRKGLLHRAFSVFLFDSNRNLLLQRRAFGKYHCGGLWSNTCCGHPCPGEDTDKAAMRRLGEEMGIRTHLQKFFEFTYCTHVSNGLTENEIDHVFVGNYDGAIELNANEVMKTEWQSIDTVRDRLNADPEQFTPWFLLSFNEVVSRLASMPGQ